MYDMETNITTMYGQFNIRINTGQQVETKWSDTNQQTVKEEMDGELYVITSYQ
jgi:hypothetical protein